jgi:hypothetical protein
MRLLSLCLFSLALFFPMVADADDWDWRVTPYFWAAGIDGNTSIGPVNADIEVSFSDIVDDLQFGALIHVEAHQPGYGLFADAVYLSLEPEGSDVESLFLEAGAVWKVFNDQESGIEFGARYYDQDVTINPANLDRIRRGKSWIDGFVGVRWVVPMSDRWSFSLRGNVGAGGSDLAWSLEPSFLREFSNGNRLALGFRMLDVDFDDDSTRGVPFAMDVNYSGLIVGYTFN